MILAPVCTSQSSNKVWADNLIENYTSISFPSVHDDSAAWSWSRTKTLGKPRRAYDTRRQLTKLHKLAHHAEA